MWENILPTEGIRRELQNCKGHNGRVNYGMFSQGTNEELRNEEVKKKKT